MTITCLELSDTPSASPLNTSYRTDTKNVSEAMLVGVLSELGSNQPDPTTGTLKRLSVPVVGSGWLEPNSLKTPTSMASDTFLVSVRYEVFRGEADGVSESSRHVMVISYAVKFFSKLKQFFFG